MNEDTNSQKELQKDSQKESQKELQRELKKDSQNEYRKESYEYKPRVFTEEEINSQLQGYIFVIPSNWEKLTTGDHIKYLRNDGNFRRGGYICNKWERGGKKFFHLENRKGGCANGLKNGAKIGKDGKYISYPVAYEDIKSLFKRVDNAIEIGMIKEDLQRKKDQIEILTRELITLKKKVGDLEAGRRKSL